MISLDAYFDKVMGQPWVWGRMDCGCFACDWIRDATGRDPLALLRGTYSTARGAATMIAARGGMLALVDAEMERHGFERTTAPEHGDVGLIDLPGGSGEHTVARASMVIRSGPWWIGRTLDGIAGVTTPPIAAWRVL